MSTEHKQTKALYICEVHGFGVGVCCVNGEVLDRQEYHVADDGHVTLVKYKGARYVGDEG